MNMRSLSLSPLGSGGLVSATKGGFVSGGQAKFRLIPAILLFAILAMFASMVYATTLVQWTQNTFIIGVGTFNNTAPTNGGYGVSLMDANSVSANGRHTIVLRSDGTLWACGEGNNGELGLGGTGNYYTFQQVGMDSDWESVSCGADYTLAIKNNGTLWAWGYGGNGVLGTNGTGQQNSPVQIGTDTDWRQVSAGDANTHSLGVKDNNTLWFWGDNTYGQRGNGVTGGADQLSPVQVGLSTDWWRVEAGGRDSFGIKTDYTLWAWGENNNGELGLGNFTSPVNTPTQVAGIGWTYVNAGSDYTMAILGGPPGTLWAWGYGGSGAYPGYSLG